MSGINYLHPYIWDFISKLLEVEIRIFNNYWFIKF